MRVLLTMEYCGTGFCGFQRQGPGKPTVQQALEDAVYAATGARSAVFCSGRTDAGVHALGQTAHFDTACAIPAERMLFALNRYLPKSVRVLESREVAESFHARFSVRRKTYLYKMYRGLIERPLCADRELLVPPQLDLSRMERAAQYFVGEHDFACLQGRGSETNGTVRTVYAARFEEDAAGLRFYVTGSGFLYHMVRNMVGTLLEIGLNDREPEDVPRLLAGRDRTAAGPTAPAHGLYLYAVEY